MTQGKVLCFDYGLARVGVAVADLKARIAHPLTTLSCKGGSPNPAKVEQLVARWRPRQIVIGRPAEHSPPALLNGIDRFARRMERQFGLPVSRTDESYSSLEAKERLRRQRRASLRSTIGKDEVDKIAACVILESWLAANPPE